VIETVVGLLAIYLVAGKYEMPEDVFKLSIKEPLKKPNGWLVWVLWGYVLAPVVIGILSNSIEAVGYDVSRHSTTASLHLTLPSYSFYCR
jgi:ABC-type Fe3+ transport system permease subunit